MSGPREFNAFHGYPEPSEPRYVSPNLRKIENRIIASYRGREFYDGDRTNGYGGMKDDGRWKKIAENLIQDYNLSTMDHVLQINAHKGFLLYELYRLGIRTTGTEVSEYVAPDSAVVLTRCPFTKQPFEDKTFDLVICASPAYSENLAGCIQIIKEVQRVGKGKSFITLAAIDHDDDIDSLMLLRNWFLLGTTILTKSDWVKVMEHCGYTGDYRFDTAEYLNLAWAQ